MKQTGRVFISILIIMILLPYVVTVFIHGIDTNADENDWEEYLLGELAAEISGDAPAEAVKAQAVIARTKLYKKIKDGEKLEDLYIDPRQAEKSWGSSHYKEYYQKFKNAIQSTEHQVLKYDGKLIDASYHQLSAGKTRSASEMGMEKEFSYLQAKECSHDPEAYNYAREILFSMDELAGKLKIDESKDGELKPDQIKIKKEDSCGYALTVQIGKETMNGETFREKLELPSSCMKFTVQDQTLVIMTKGIGHGLGLSQNAAIQMAEEGNEYRDILEYFYTDTEIADGGNLPE